MASRSATLSLPRSSPRPGHDHRDRLRHDGRVERDMIFVSQQELKRMPAWLSVAIGRGLPAAEVQMIGVVGVRIIERRQFGIDQEVMMTGIGPLDARGCYAHV